MKSSLLEIVLILTLFNQTHSVFKCNQKILNKFMLKGMAYSIYDKMTICA